MLLVLISDAHDISAFVHGDVKLENFCFTRNDQRINIKICDLGSVRPVDWENVIDLDARRLRELKVHRPCGTSIYSSRAAYLKIVNLACFCFFENIAFCRLFRRSTISSRSAMSRFPCATVQSAGNIRILAPRSQLNRISSAAVRIQVSQIYVCFESLDTRVAQNCRRNSVFLLLLLLSSKTIENVDAA